jgi:hypothetical protein
VGDEGKIISEDEAIRRYKATGKHLGIFKDPESATRYAQQLHNDYESGKIVLRPTPLSASPQQPQPSPMAALRSVVQEGPPPQSQPPVRVDLPQRRKRSVMSVLGDVVQAGADGAATPNVAYGGATDILRAMSNAGDMGRQRQMQDMALQRQRQMDQFTVSKDARDWGAQQERERHNRQVEKSTADRIANIERTNSQRELTSMLKDPQIRVLGESEKAPDGRSTFNVGGYRAYRLSPEEVLATEIESGKRVPVSLPEGMEKFYGGRKNIFVPVGEADSWQKLFQSSKDNAPQVLEAMKQGFYKDIDTIAPVKTNKDENERLRASVDSWFTAGKPERAAMAIDMASRRLSGQEFAVSPEKIAATAAAAAAGATSRLGVQMGGLTPGALPPEAAGRLNTIVDNIRQDKYISVYKQAKPLHQSIAKAAAAENGVGDLAMLRNFARLLDPNTGVREEEYRSMQGAVGSLQRAGVAVTRGWWTGEQLTPAGRQAFKKMADELFAGYEQNKAEAERLYGAQAKAIGVDPSLLFGERSGPAPQGQPQEQQNLVRIKSKSDGKIYGVAPDKVKQKIATGMYELAQ